MANKFRKAFGIEDVPEDCQMPTLPAGVGAGPTARAGLSLGDHRQKRSEAYANFPASGHQISRRPSIALARVRRSAYSSSPPMGTPVAIRLVRTPSGRSSLAR